MRDTTIRHLWEYLNFQAEAHASTRRNATGRGQANLALSAGRLEQEMNQAVRAMRLALTADPTAIAVTLDREGRVARVWRNGWPHSDARDYGSVVLALEGYGSFTRAETQDVLNQERVGYYVTRGQEVPE